MFYAHSPDAAGRAQPLAEHLRAVADGTRSFANALASGDLGFWTGLWHDIGKFRSEFQAYLASPSAPPGPDHKLAGTALAARFSDLLPVLIAGHHGERGVAVNVTAEDDRLKVDTGGAALRLASIPAGGTAVLPPFSLEAAWRASPPWAPGQFRDNR